MVFSFIRKSSPTVVVSAKEIGFVIVFIVSESSFLFCFHAPAPPLLQEEEHKAEDGKVDSSVEYGNVDSSVEVFLFSYFIFYFNSIYLI